MHNIRSTKESIHDLIWTWKLGPPRSIGMHLLFQPWWFRLQSYSRVPVTTPWKLSISLPPSTNLSRHITEKTTFLCRNLKCACCGPYCSRSLCRQILLTLKRKSEAEPIAFVPQSQHLIAHNLPKFPTSPKNKTGIQHLVFKSTILNVSTGIKKKNREFQY